MNSVSNATASFEIPDSIAEVRNQYQIRQGVTFLNHGSFGFRAQKVLEATKIWADSLQQQPMDYFVRTHRVAIENVIARLSEYLGTSADKTVLCHNATEAMNALANHFPLQEGDEVLLNDHEYGAVIKIWERKCRLAGAKVRMANISMPVESIEDVAGPILENVNEKTKLVVLSHITSPTAIRFPVEHLLKELKNKGVLVCIDGPHAIAQLDLNLEELGADFYTASCHKWLAGPIGTGFLHVKNPEQFPVEPVAESWGVLPPETPQKWNEKFIWQGTSDPTCYLGLPAAIDFLNQVGLQEVRTYCHQLASWTKEYLEKRFDQNPSVPSGEDWITTMALVKLPHTDKSLTELQGLQEELWEKFQIEVPIIEFDGKFYVRVSCYLYNRPKEIEFLADSILSCLK